MQKGVIGILTFHDTNNFGSLLQTFGLYRKIQDLGYKSEIIDYQCESIIKREKPHDFSFTQSPKDILKYLWLEPIKKKKYRSLNRFLFNHMIVSRQCYRDDVNNIVDNYDKIVVGSDIVWGLDITGGDLTYFLDFCSDKNKKFAFSSSVGNKWNNEEQQIVAPLLQDFRYVAVREEESADWVEELTGKRPSVVSDPTMLLTPEEWSKYVGIKPNLEKYILVYFENSNGDCVRTALEIAKNTGYKVKYINYGIPKKGVSNVRPHTLEEFLSLVANAYHVVTASYHGMLFSIYFERQFTFFNRAHKSRMNTLSQKLGVEHRNGECDNVLKLPPIDYNVVTVNVSRYRDYSVDCLKRMLEM